MDRDDGVLEIVGNCPTCGAPVYGEKKINIRELDALRRLSTDGTHVMPTIEYSCSCLRVPQGYWGVPQTTYGSSVPYITSQPQYGSTTQPETWADLVRTRMGSLK
jgi:hypothetical protein